MEKNIIGWCVVLLYGNWLGLFGTGRGSFTDFDLNEYLEFKATITPGRSSSSQTKPVKKHNKGNKHNYRETGTSTQNNSSLGSTSNSSFSRTIAEQAQYNAVDELGKTLPLHEAAYKGHGAVVEILLRAGADKTAVSKDGWAPLHMAAWDGHEAVVEVLLQAGVDKNAISEDGWTPLHLAAVSGQRTIVEILLRSGANRFVVDKDGKTSLEIARSNVIDLLK